MDYNNNLQELKKFLEIKEGKLGLTHNLAKRAPLLPFKTRFRERPQFTRGFDGVLGEFVRLVSETTLNKNIDIDFVIANIINSVTLNEEDKPYFEKLLKLFLLDQHHSFKVFHPHIFQYFSPTEGDQGKGELEIALFIRDILIVNGEDNIKAFFQKGDSTHIISKLILDQLNYLDYKKKDKKYIGKIPVISQHFTDDLKYLLNHKEYLTENFSLFLSYYYFFYITQFTLKLSQQTRANLNNINEVYYTLDWEGTSKSRISTSKGYQLIKSSASNLLIYANTLEHLNFIFGTIGLTLPELEELFISKTKAEQETILATIQEWVKEYRFLLELPELDRYPYDYQGLTDLLFESIDYVHAVLPTKQGTKSRYALYLEEIGKRYFLKTRGSLGYMLNITQDLLLLLTAVCVKDERKSLKNVFKELENRGVFLDRYSQDAVVHLFDKLNLLDKKSDSGDAQYVKPIL
ncbi:DNA phosphorothioation-dependent restriction protein DptG [Neobacillus cucumis]|nr:DNA phosphorothioation-dependent restriction protein DptG [Neobacillus cucumis]